ncbi:hypothetical protein NFIA_023500 [Paecilomyces variotii No. 5]|uniref:Serine aminopeptidase S33 domain-containing protein n=1 Tax=Byssochlamys spectabilis (strain No. 5 / NBRC 109023) TaxID=1356009 RepID=V5I511_BYSSN|nr:hypothetical protein NFIA_023500 [Paecilomyces variotii No. 5]
MSQNAEFKTVDGITLRGILFPTSQRGPAIIMTPGFNCVKEMSLPAVAKRFQKAGITAFVYDPRTIGESDGLPRNDIDPAQQVEDLSDALTFMTTLPSVDSECIGLWGHSYSGMIALVAASIDKRAKFVIAVCPMVITHMPYKVPQAFEMSIQDKERRLQGNGPLYNPPFNIDGTPILDFPVSAGQEAERFMIGAPKRGAKNYVHHVTVQTFARTVKWQPHGLLEFLKSTPVLFLVPENDGIVSPKDQLNMFNSLSTPKRLYIGKGKTHFTILGSDTADVVQNCQIRFIRDSLEGNVRQDKRQSSDSKL